MKKFLSILLVLMVLLSLSTSSVLADGNLTLVETRNDAGGGVIFVLEFDGEFPRNYFRGFVTEGDNRYPIHCNVVSDTQVQCTVSRAVAGKNVVLYVGDFVFWTFVPETSGLPNTTPSQYCYDVFNAQTENESEFFWVPVGFHCQDAPASNGDPLEYDSMLYEFWDVISDGNCGVNGNSQTGFFQLCF